MRVLVIGDGAQDHALCWKLVESPLVDELHSVPGNEGIAMVAECVPFSVKAVNTIVDFCDDNEIEFIVINALPSLSLGLVDMLDRKGYPSFGPDLAGVRLESWKAFARRVYERHNIPTPRFACFDTAEAAKKYLAETGIPAVVKGDVAIDGKKVSICRTLEEAEAAVDARLKAEDKAEIVIEELLSGEEVGFMAITDGNVILPLTSTTAHWDGEGSSEFPGALSPAPAVTPEVQAEIIDRILVPTIEGMKSERNMCKGLLNARVMLTAEGPKLLDYKVRFTDPDWAAIALRISGDLMPALVSSFDEMLYRFNDFRWLPESAAVLVLTVDKEKASLEKIACGCDLAEEADEDIVVFRAHDSYVLHVTASGTDLTDMRKRLHAAAATIISAFA
jgi:phosphoribosylamine---glycine ligase